MSSIRALLKPSLLVFAFVILVHATQTDIVTLPVATYPSGTTSFGPVVVPNGSSQVTVKISLAALPALAHVIGATLQASPDGIAWTTVGSSELDCTKANLSLAVLTAAGFTGFRVTLPPGTTRIRGAFTLNSSLATSVTVTFA